jgi:hypothetical protein
LPIPAEIYRGAASQRKLHHATGLLAVARPAKVFTPGNLLGIAAEIAAGDMMVMPAFTPAQAGEIEFRGVGAGAVQAIGSLVVDALHGELGMQLVPGRALIGVGRCCTDRRMGRINPIPIRPQAIRTEVGRPSASMQFKT